MAATQSDLNDGAIEGPLAQQKPMVEPPSANTQVEIYLSAMADSFSTTNNLFQSLQGVLAHISRDHQARHNAHSCEIRKKQAMIEGLEEKVREKTQDINYLHRVNASLQRRLGEANAINGELHENTKLFTRTLGDTIAQLMEGRKKKIPDSQDAFGAATCPKHTAERDPQLLDWETPVDAQRSPMVVQDIARTATVVQGGGVVMENSGSESRGIKPYRLRRKSRMPQGQLTLEIPGKTP